MPCHFPGMDPYIERPAIFPDFHDSLVVFIKSALQPLLRPRYVALGRERLYVLESERAIYPDVSVVPTGSSKRSTGTGVAMMQPDAPTVFELSQEEIREPVIHIIEPAAGNRIVTALEVMSPTNKTTGPGRDSFLEKRDELWDGGSNLVEIDLLRDGEPTVRVSQQKLTSLRPWHYLVAVTRRSPPRQEVYAIPLQRRLPRVSIPLAADDKDVTLDLQAVFTRCWDEGPYPELLHYDGPPPGTMTPDEGRWCESLLQTAGFRPKPPVRG